MKNEVIIAAAETFIGLILMIYCDSWGNQRQDSRLIANGGQADKNTYLMKRETFYGLFFSTDSNIIFNFTLFLSNDYK